jgi:hypothetical protein
MRLKKTKRAFSRERVEKKVKDKCNKWGAIATR